MDIQSIYGGTKNGQPTPSSTDEEAAPASGFAALLDLVSSQFKATLGLGAMDPNVLKNAANADTVRAPEPRETKPRPDRADDRDAKAKPTDEDQTDDAAADEAAAADEQNSDAGEANTQAQTGAEEQVAQAVAATVIDVALMAQANTQTTVVAADAAVATETVAVVAETEVAAAETVVVDKAVASATTVVDPKAAMQTEVKAVEKAIAPEAVTKDTARVQQALSAYAPQQTAAEVETVAVDAEAAAVKTEAGTKDIAARTDSIRSAAAQDQANSLARLLGSENRIQVQVSVNAAQTVKQAVADVSIYNIYAGYTAADAISLANGQFGQAEENNAVSQSVPTRTTETAAQTAVAVQAPQLSGGAPSNTNATAPARAEGAPAVAVQAGASSGGASNTNFSFANFTSSGNANTQATQQAAQPNPTDRPAATAQHVIDQIKVNITKAAKAGLDRVTIQLKPVELGRIEIKLEMSEDHKVRVTVTADNKDTLNLLQTDSRTLERTLNDAGLRTDANNLHFNLRSDTDAGAADGQRGNGGNKNNGNAHADTANDNAEQDYDYTAAAFARGGVDTFA